MAQIQVPVRRITMQLWSMSSECTEVQRAAATHKGNLGSSANENGLSVEQGAGDEVPSHVFECTTTYAMMNELKIPAKLVKNEEKARAWTV